MIEPGTYLLTASGIGAGNVYRVRSAGPRAVVTVSEVLGALSMDARFAGRGRRWLREEIEPLIESGVFCAIDERAAREYTDKRTAMIHELGSYAAFKPKAESLAREYMTPEALAALEARERRDIDAERIHRELMHPVPIGWDSCEA